jgi:ATP-binding cassette subfamily B protein
MANRSTDTPTAAAWRTFRQFWPLARADARLLILGGLLAILTAGCEVVVIWLFGVITDHALAARNLSAFWMPATAWLGAAIASAAAAFAGDYATALAGERFLFRLRNSIFAHVQRLPLDFFDNSRLGDLMARLTDDIEAIEQLVASGLVRLVASAVSIVLFAGAAFYVRWDLALAACALVPLFWLVSKVFAGRVQQAAAEERASNGSISSVVEESLSNQAIVQAYNRQQTEERRLHEEGLTWLRAKMAETRLSALYQPLVQVVETVCVLVVLGMGAWELSTGRISLGGLLSFAAFLGYLYPPVQGLGQLSLSMAEATAASDRLAEVRSAQPAVTDATARYAPWHSRGRVDFVDVSFQYPQASRRTLNGLSFTAEPGELVMVAGRSGAGKSTVTKLLLRFYDPAAGQVLLDGVDIRTLSLRTLRENVTLLHQESMLFPGTVRDNIAYGRPAATDEEIVQAAIAADAHAFISALPEGYQTQIGQRGRLLSGGQRQRIAIARAMIRNTPVLVLDEPTTGLDPQTAARIMEPLRRLMAGRTTILITHDAQVAPHPDQVITITEDPAIDVLEEITAQPERSRALLRQAIARS